MSPSFFSIGLMWSAALLHKVLNFLAFPIDVRNCCVFLAPLFASLTVLVTYLLTKEVRDKKAGLFAAAFVAIAPGLLTKFFSFSLSSPWPTGYISRSVAGSFDNECISIFALLLVFYLWVKAVKNGSMFWAASAALAYFYMAAAWGGYIFIINLIPLYVFVMLIFGRSGGGAPSRANLTVRRLAASRRACTSPTRRSTSWAFSCRCRSRSSVSCPSRVVST